MTPSPDDKSPWADAPERPVPPTPPTHKELIFRKAKVLRERMEQGHQGVDDSMAEAILGLMQQNEPYRAGPLRRLVASEIGRAVLMWAASEMHNQRQSPIDVIRALLDETTSLIVSIVFNNLGRPNEHAVEALGALYESFGQMLRERLGHTNQLFDEIERQEEEAEEEDEDDGSD